jgi:hypothetical protein
MRSQGFQSLASVPGDFSPLATRHSPLITRHSPLITRHAPLKKRGLAPAEEPGLGRLEAALAKAVAALAVEKKIRDAVRAGALDRAPGDVLADRALEAGVISADERKCIQAADEARDEAIQVDAFTQDEYAGMRR